MKAKSKALSVLIGAMLSSSVASAGILEDHNWSGSLKESGANAYMPAVSNPLFNETPYITTELRPIYLHNKIPSSFLTGGGTIDIAAAEIRIALTDRLGFIASKDGYAELDFKHTLPDEKGFANISAGLKYAVVNDLKNETIVTIGAEYEPPSGNLNTAGIVMQGDGKGFIDLFISGATTFDKVGVQGNVGFNMALDDDDSSLMHASAHVNYELFEGFYPLVEMNTFTTIQSGKRLPFSFEGVDIVNFGNTGSNGTVATGAIGARYRINDNIMLGAAYEKALTDREDLIDYRTYVDMVIHF